MIPNERLVAMFAALDDDGRRYAELILQHEYDRVQKTKRPALRTVVASQATAINRDEAALLAHFRAMDDDGRHDGLCIMEELAGPYRRPRPALTLAYGGTQGGAR